MREQAGAALQAAGSPALSAGGAAAGASAVVATMQLNRHQTRPTPVQPKPPTHPHDHLSQTLETLTSQELLENTLDRNAYNRSHERERSATYSHHQNILGLINLMFDLKPRLK
jgi:retron-type reverse transcriptase